MCLRWEFCFYGGLAVSYCTAMILAYKGCTLKEVCNPCSPKQALIIFCFHLSMALLAVSMQMRFFHYSLDDATAMMTVQLRTLRSGNQDAVLWDRGKSQSYSWQRAEVTFSSSANSKVSEVNADSQLSNRCGASWWLSGLTQDLCRMPVPLSFFKCLLSPSNLKCLIQTKMP